MDYLNGLMGFAARSVLLAGFALAGCNGYVDEKVRSGAVPSEPETVPSVDSDKLYSGTVFTFDSNECLGEKGTANRGAAITLGRFDYSISDNGRTVLVNVKNQRYACGGLVGDSETDLETYLEERRLWMERGI